MASLESKLFNFLLVVINKKKFLEMQFAFGRFDFYDSREPPRETYKACHVQKSQFMGRNVFTLTPTTGKSDKRILYFHGGAYVQNFVRQHWTFLAMLVKRAHCTVIAPDYPLAPQATYIDAFNMAIPLYEEIVSQAGAHNLILMGDSAGGGFALALAQRMRSNYNPVSGGLVLLSPWLDLTLSNPEISEIDSLDPFLSVKGLRKAGLSFAGNSDPAIAALSPINGSFEGLGKISVFIGSRDIFVADARKLKRLALASNVNFNYREYEDMVHVWMLLNFRESQQAKQEIVDLIASDKTVGGY